MLICLMAIKGFKSTALRRAFSGDYRRIHAQHRATVRRVLTALDTSAPKTALGITPYRLHPLKGNLAGSWAVRVSRSWRIIFRIETSEDGPEVCDVDLIDYH